MGILQWITNINVGFIKNKERCAQFINPPKTYTKRIDARESRKEEIK
jgi:hypothetical protein